MDNNNIQQVKNLLSNSDKDTLPSVIEQIRDTGVPKLLPTLVDIYKKCDDTDVRTAIFNLLSDVSQRDIVDAMVDCIINETDINVKQMLITSCWYSRIDYLPRLEVFIDLVLSSPFELAFEAFTVIENRPSEISDERREQLTSYINNRIDNVTKGNEELAKGLLRIIGNHN